ncbi:MAG: M6 family metalloprotease domain-containing protein [Bacteroidales bacterium]|nr:M6 family metalloprotease domain-containing protein [Bacteroidales bacterium]
MKKTIILLAVLFSALQVSNAIPAKKGKIVRVQPDGSKITILLHGDEFKHWATTEDGTIVAPDANGFYKPASMPLQEQLGGREAAAANNAALLAKRLSNGPLMAKVAKTYHFPVILVQFSDVKFSVNNPKTAFSNLLNQEGYSENGATGSVHDYYWENSMQTFDAQFDVFGPYTYNGTCAANANENDAAKLLWAAIKAYDNSVDWSKYDNDGDGVVDMVFMYYAGYNEAEGDPDTIWPHKYNFYYAGVSTSTLDNVSFDVYACTSELKGTYGKNMCGIGTCAHEFSHTQGLPDFYDVNYDKYGDGEAGATYSYDIMCSGAYNNEGRTPPYFTAEERIMMGWLDSYENLPSSGDITIPAVNTNFAYKAATSNTSGNGEYFVFECRSGKGWDAYLEPGLVVYHVDKSTKYNVTYKTSTSSSNTRTPYQIWTSYSQYINASGSHPCFYIVPAADQDNLFYGGSEAKLPFPGAAGVSFYSPTDWEGKSYNLYSDIAFHSDGEYVTMSCIENYPGIQGFVKNSSGDAVPGATVNIYSSNNPSSNIIGYTGGIQKISGRILDNLRLTATTDENGFYSFDLSDYANSNVDIEVVARGYITKYETMPVPAELQARNFTMRGINEPVSYTLKKFTSLADVTGVGAGSTCNAYASICLTADELSEYVGRKILTLAFAYSSGDTGSVSSVYGIIDAGTSRVFSSAVSNPASGEWNIIDVSSNNLYIQEGTDYHFGYGLLRCTYGYPMVFSEEEAAEGGFCYYLVNSSSTLAQSVPWSELPGYGNLLIYVVLDDSSEVNYNYIANPGYGSYSVGEQFALTLVEATGDRKPGSEISWYFDDEPVAVSSNPVSGASVQLKYAGWHVVEARFTTTDGKTKVVDLEINVNL